MSIYYVIDSDTLEDMADSIRTKKGYNSNHKIGVNNYSSEIDSIDNSQSIDNFVFGADNSADLTSDNQGAVADYAFYHNQKIKSVSLPNATAIGEHSFKSCGNLATFSAPSVLTVGQYAFGDGTTTAGFPHTRKLATVNLQSATNIGSWAFLNCTALTTINAPSVTTAGESVFTGCSSLTSLSMPNLTSIPAGFCGQCSSLADISFPNATQISSSFGNCTSLVDISLPNVTSTTGGSFSACTSLKTVNLPKLVSASNTLFSGCTALESLTIPDVEQVSYGAFYNCTNLEYINSDEQGLVYLPKANFVDNTGSSASYGTFGSCSKIKKVLMPNNKKYQSYAFYNCTALEEVDIGSPATIYNDTFRGCTALKKLTIRTTGTAPSIQNYAFRNLTMSNITIYVSADLLSAYQNMSVLSGATIVAMDSDFTLDGTTYTSELAESWISWVASQNNTIGATVKGSMIFNSTNTAYLSDGTNSVAPGDTINSSTSYTWVTL